jgi:hypothetical protein
VRTSYVEGEGRKAIAIAYHLTGGTTNAAAGVSSILSKIVEMGSWQLAKAVNIHKRTFPMAAEMGNRNA